MKKRKENFKRLWELVNLISEVNEKLGESFFCKGKECLAFLVFMGY